MFVKHSIKTVVFMTLWPTYHPSYNGVLQSKEFHHFSLYTGVNECDYDQSTDNNEPFCY